MRVRVRVVFFSFLCSIIAVGVGEQASSLSSMLAARLACARTHLQPKPSHRLIRSIHIINNPTHPQTLLPSLGAPDSRRSNDRRDEPEPPLRAMECCGSRRASAPPTIVARSQVRFGGDAGIGWTGRHVRRLLLAWDCPPSAARACFWLIAASAAALSPQQAGLFLVAQAAAARAPRRLRPHRDKKR